MRQRIYGRLIAGTVGGLLVAQLGATVVYSTLHLTGKLDGVADSLYPAAAQSEIAMLIWGLLAVFIWFIGPMIALSATTSWAAWRQLSYLSAVLAFALAAIAFVAAGTDTTFADIKTAYTTFFGQFDRSNPGAILHALPALGAEKLFRIGVPICFVIGLFLLLAAILSGREDDAPMLAEK